MEFLVPIFIYAVSTGITPGPNNIMLMTSSLNFGVRKSYPHLLGVCVGFPVMVIAIGLGLGFIFDRYPFLHDIIKVVGVVYLLYLSWCIAKASPVHLDVGGAKPISFWQAALFQWVNPKAWVMATGAVAAFTVSDANIYLQILLIAFMFFLTSIPCMGVWLFFGLAIKKLLKAPSSQKRFNFVMALLLAVSVTPVIAELIDKINSDRLLFLST